MADLFDIKNIQKAKDIVRDVALVTPLQHNERLSEQYDANVYFKREDLQPIRSFKLRGAYHKIYKLSDAERKLGIVCASAGNHAQGVALACNKLGIKGTIFMPVPTPKQKLNQVRMFGGENIETRLVGDTFDDAYAAAQSFKDKSNEVLQEMIDKDPKSKKIFDAYEDFRVKFKDWSVVSDKIYYEL